MFAARDARPTDFVRVGAAYIARVVPLPFYDPQQHPPMEEVRSGRRPFVILDVLHRESLMKLIGRYGIRGLNDADIDHLNHAWHRLDPWPDAVEGLSRLKKKYIIAPCSNGNIALMVNMAKRAGLPWDCILGAEIAHAYKPMPEAYLASCRSLGLVPANVL